MSPMEHYEEADRLMAEVARLTGPAPADEVEWRNAEADRLTRQALVHATLARVR